MAVRTTEIARTFGSAPHEWFKPIVPAILAVVLPWARFCTSQQVDSAAHCFHMNAAHAGGPLLAGQHRAQRVFAAFFFDGGRCCCSVIGEVEAARVSVRVDRGQ